jgi:hypothetical protein
MKNNGKRGEMNRSDNGVVMADSGVNNIEETA